MSERVVITRLPPGGIASAAISRVRRAHSDVWMWTEPKPLPHSMLQDQIATATGLYSMLTDRIDEDLLTRAPRLRVISQMAVGVDNIDLAACAAKGIRVGHTPDVLTETTADLAFGLIIAGARRFAEGMVDVKEGRWGDWDPSYLAGNDVYGTTLGIAGFGRIGQAVARRATGFEMRVIYHQRTNLNNSTAEHVSFSDLLAQSDHLVLAAPLNSTTHHLISSEQFAQMKPTANLINIGRGPLVDPDALVRALTDGQISSAALDVTEPEPIPRDHPLVSLPNCLIVPHIGSSSIATRAAMADLAASNLVAALAGNTMVAEVLL